MNSAKPRKSTRAKPEPSSASDIEARVYATLFDAIMNLRLTPGTKLPESALCDLFSVNRSLVRRVLQRLAHDHVIELRPNRGAVVATPGAKETSQIFEARRALESAIVSLATRNAKPADFRDLRRQLAAERDAMHRFEQPAWARLASTFHLQVATLARNPILEAYLKEMVSRCSLIVALYEPSGNACCEHAEHEQIVLCMERGDAAGAARLMEAHLLELERHIALRPFVPQKTLKQRLGL